jgi:hypothetical protein
MAPYGASAATKTWSPASQTGSGASCATTWTPRLPGRPTCRSCWSRWSTCSAHTRPHPGCWAGSGMVLPDREPQPELDQCPAGPLPDRQGRFAGLGHRLVPSRLRPQFRGALAGELLNKKYGCMTGVPLGVGRYARFGPGRPVSWPTPRIRRPPGGSADLPAGARRALAPGAHRVREHEAGSPAGAAVNLSWPLGPGCRLRSGGRAMAGAQVGPIRGLEAEGSGRLPRCESRGR